LRLIRVGAELCREVRSPGTEMGTTVLNSIKNMFKKKYKKKKLFTLKQDDWLID